MVAEGIGQVFLVFQTLDVWAYGLARGKQVHHIVVDWLVWSCVVYQPQYWLDVLIWLQSITIDQSLRHVSECQQVDLEGELDVA